MAFNIGVLGTGSLTRNTAVALIKDATSDHQDDVHLFVSAQHYTDAVRFATDLADSAPFTLSVFDSGIDSQFESAHGEVFPSDDGAASIIQALGPGGTLLFAYDEDEPPGQEALLTQALKAGLIVLDLCGGLFPLELGPEGDEAQQTTSPSTPQVQDDPRETHAEELQAVQADAKAAAADLKSLTQSTDLTPEIIMLQTAWERFSTATTPFEQATNLLALKDAVGAFRPFLVAAQV